jgi:aerobic carbon-monoxide dehydrogenase medium subunit
MYPARFEYVRPESLDEAVEALERGDGDAKVLAGGMSLIPLMKLRFAAPSTLIDINRIEGLDGLAEDGGRLRIGALVRHKACERSQLLRGRYGVLGEAARVIADPIVRNLGTVCGSLAHADPAGDWGSALLAVRAEVVARGPDGERVIPIDELFVAPFTTSLRPGEILTEVRVRDSSVRAGGAYLKLERKVGDFATAAVGVHLSFSNGTVERAGIALTAVGPTNLRATAAEQALAGRALDDAAVDEASRLAAEAAEPIADVRGGVEFKRDVVRVLTARALRRAAEAADEPGDGDGGEPERFAGHETIEGVMDEIREKEES